MGKGKYTLLHQDASHFLLQHPNGQHFKVARNAIDNKTSNEISKMAGGGEVEEPSQAPSTVSNWEALKKGMSAIPDAVSEGATAAGDILSSAEKKINLDNFLPTPTPLFNPEKQDYTPQSGTSQASADDSPQMTPATHIDIMPQGAPPPTGDAPQAPQGGAPLQPSQWAIGQMGPDGLYDFQKMQMQGINESARAKADEGNAAAKIQEGLAKQVADFDRNLQADREIYTQRNDALYAQMMSPQNQINQNRVFENMGTGGKITAIISMVLGGIGAGLTHGPNMALEAINKSIDRDIDSQKANLANKNSLFAKNLEMLHNVDSAAAMTKSNMLTMAAAMTNKIVGQNAGPQAQAQAKMMTGQFLGQANNQIYEISKQRAASRMMTEMTSGGSSQADPSRRLEAMKLTGLIGDAQYAEGNKEIGYATKTKAAHAAIDNIYDQLAEIQTLGNRALNPIQSQQRIRALTGQLYPLLIEANPSKRLTKESLEAELEPFMVHLSSDRTTQKRLRMGAHHLVDSLAAPAPTLNGIGIKVPSHIQVIKHPPKI